MQIKKWVSYYNRFNTEQPERWNRSENTENFDENFRDYEIRTIKGYS